MATEDVKRKLTAIFSADVQGYSRLMGDDERATVETITAYRRVMTDLIQAHHGSVKDAKGDNVLAEFTSVVDAIQCAVEIQKKLGLKNTDLPEERRMAFRIGVNLGDVIEKEDTIYGDGVNIAARLESLAEGGGICISGTAFDQVGKKLPLGYKYMGEQKVKNIEKTIRTYRVLLDPESVGKVIGEKHRLKMWHWTAIFASIVLIGVAGGMTLWEFYGRPDVTPASIEKTAFPQLDKPSIAVLPFDNLSGDPEQEYFSDGMTDDIITDLSKISDLMVISRNSAFTYKGKELKIPIIAKELGVRYVLEGSVRRAGNEIRINAQLIDAVSDQHIWADRFDGKNENIFDLQDRITGKIVSALSLKLSNPEQKVITEVGTHNYLAYDEYLKGMKYMRTFTPIDYAKAVEHFKKAVEIDRNYSQAYANLAHVYLNALQGGNKFWDELGVNFPTARLLARYYLELAMKNPTSTAYQGLARLELYKRNFSRAIDYAEKAVATAPNDADALERLGYTMVFTGNPVDAIKYFKRSIMLDPLHKSTGGIGLAYFTMGDYEQAIKYLEKQLRDYPETYGINGWLASAYASIGNDVKANKAFKDFFT